MASSLRFRALSAAMAAALVAGSGLVAPAAAFADERVGGGSAASVASAESAGGVSAASVASGDSVALSIGTTDGVDVVAADAAAPGRWRVVTHLWVQGWDAPSWTSEDCRTGDGRFLAVAIAPAGFADRPALRDAGALGVVVDLAAGTQWVVPVRVALRYDSPGCGTGSEVVFSRTTGSGAGGTGAGRTELVRVDAASRRIIDRRGTGVAVGSAVPVAGGVVAAAGRSLVSVSPSGATTVLTDAPGPVYTVRPSTGGAIDYLSMTGSATATAYSRSTRGKVSRIADGPLRNLSLVPGRSGATRVVGQARDVASGVDSIRLPDRPLAVSLDGGLAVQRADVPGVTSSRPTGAPVRIVSRSRTTAEVTTSEVTTSEVTTSEVTTSEVTTSEVTSSEVGRLPASAGSGTARPAAAVSAAATAGSPCSVAPLDPSTQIIQPSNAQLEWAAVQAVSGRLLTARPANWQQHGLPSYSPQSLFPLPALSGGGTIPVQIVLGVLAQESNFSQASWHALAGVPGDPLVSDYYGALYADGYITGMNPAGADCGYGAGQITDYMTTADTTWTADQKRAVATDYQANVAATAMILAQKWNELKSLGLSVNGGESRYLENWYLALWSYNTGVHQPTSGGQPWGLGWTNNPIQNSYDLARQPFLLKTYDDAAHPGRWPYQEKVLGWAAHPQLDLTKGGAKYTPAATILLSTDYTLFCGPGNHCDPTSTATGYCLYTDRTQCWWHGTASWIEGGDGSPQTTIPVGSSEPANAANPYPPACAASSTPVVQMPGTTALPSGAVVVDDLSTPAMNLAGCASGTNPGRFTLSFGTDGNGRPTGMIDTHQIGVGYLGHSYFAHTVKPARSLVITTGTWTPPSSVTGWQHIWVHIPDNGADTAQADYHIYTGTGWYHRVVPQRWNKRVWVDLGSFQLSAGAYVQLSNATYSDYDVARLRAVDIAWDAIAFTPTTRPAVSYVALGDSYQAGEGVAPYYENSDNGGNTRPHTDACHRSPRAYPAQVYTNLKARHPGNAEYHFAACSGAVITEVLGPIDAGSLWPEVPELESGWLDENTTHVTVGIGGNDARFSDILSTCALFQCLENGYRLTSSRAEQPDPEALVTYEAKVVRALDAPLRAVYNTIRRLAPNAQIIVVGYPHVVATSSWVSGGWCNLLFSDSVVRKWFADTGDLLRDTIRTAAEASGATFVDTIALYSGHEACSGSAWINDVEINTPSGSGNPAPGSGAFHPTAAGHAATAGAITAVLR